MNIRLRCPECDRILIADGDAASLKCVCGEEIDLNEHRRKADAYQPFEDDTNRKVRG